MPIIEQKGKKFNEMIEEMHGGYVRNLVMGVNFISCTMGQGVTMKGTGRMKMDEIVVYKVKNGKIIIE